MRRTCLGNRAGGGVAAHTPVPHSQAVVARGPKPFCLGLVVRMVTAWHHRPVLCFILRHTTRDVCNMLRRHTNDRVDDGLLGCHIDGELQRRNGSV